MRLALLGILICACGTPAVRSDAGAAARDAGRVPDVDAGEPRIPDGGAASPDAGATPPPGDPSLPFPEAQGFGTDAVGWRGGQVLHVTHCGGAGAGSLREALETPGPRVIVFDVGGCTIDAHAYTVPEGNVYVAGQSAPGGGVTVLGSLIFGTPDDRTPYADEQNIGAREILIRHLRVRDGARFLPEGHSAGDCLSFRNAADVLLDHVSLAFCADESGDARRSRRMGYQSSMIVFPARFAKHSKGEHPYGPMASYGAHDWSMIGSVTGWGTIRFPHMISGNSDVVTGGTGVPRHQLGPRDALFLFGANTVYNVGTTVGRGAVIGGSECALGCRAVVEQNRYLTGPSTPAGWVPIQSADKEPTGSIVYVDGNAWDGRVPSDQTELLSPGRHNVPLDVSTSRWHAPVVDYAALDTRCEAVGALPHDWVDARACEELAAGTGEQGAPWFRSEDPIAAPAAGDPAPDTDRDGMPDAWERSHDRDPNAADPWADQDGNGWADLEDYLNERAGGSAVP